MYLTKWIILKQTCIQDQVHSKGNNDIIILKIFACSVLTKQQLGTQQVTYDSKCTVIRDQYKITNVDHINMSKIMNYLITIKHKVNFD